MRYYETLGGTRSGTTRNLEILRGITISTTMYYEWHYEVQRVVLQVTMRYYERFKVLRVVLRFTKRYYERFKALSGF